MDNIKLHTFQKYIINFLRLVSHKKNNLSNFTKKLHFLIFETIDFLIWIIEIHRVFFETINKNSILYSWKTSLKTKHRLKYEKYKNFVFECRTRKGKYLKKSNVTRGISDQKPLKPLKIETRTSSFTE